MKKNRAPWDRPSNADIFQQMFKVTSQISNFFFQTNGVETIGIDKNEDHVNISFQQPWRSEESS